MILIGFMGAGKTSIGRNLSEILNQPFYDLDKEIMKEINMPLSKYFEIHGESQFRQLEHQYLSKYYQLPGIISTGGGCVETVENRILLEKMNNVIYLKADFDILQKRITDDQVSLRPIAQNNSIEELRSVYMNRFAFYQSCANHTIETDHLTTQEVVDGVINLI